MSVPKKRSKAQDAVQSWVRAGLRMVLITSAVISVNPQIDGFHLFVAVMSLTMVIRLFAQDEIDNAEAAS